MISWEFSGDDRYLAFYNFGISLLDVKTGKILHEWHDETSGSYATFLPNNKHMLVTRESDELGAIVTVIVWDIVRNVESSRFKIPPPYSVFKVLPGGKHLLFDTNYWSGASNAPYELHLWNIETGKQVFQFC